MTNSKVKRSPQDQYITRPQLCRAVVARLVEEDLIEWGRTQRILEPQVGTGNWIKALRQLEEKHSRSRRISVAGVDMTIAPEKLQPHVDILVAGDFTKLSGRKIDALGYWDVSLGNPPFSTAEAHIRNELRMATVVSKLLRINFMGSIERVPFWKENPPHYMWPLIPRPTFLDWSGERIRDSQGRLGSDSTEYAIFTWVTDKPYTGTQMDPLTWRQRIRYSFSG